MIFKVCCGHDGCEWSTRVELDADPGEWTAPVTSQVIDPDTNDPLVTLWGGQPLLDAYNQHYLKVHLPMSQPPMAVWSCIDAPAPTPFPDPSPVDPVGPTPTPVPVPDPDPQPVDGA